MIQSGVQENEIAKQLGHRDISFTRRLYVGVWRRQERSVDVRMQAFITSSGGM